MLKEVFFYPPLAFGRIGNSSVPLECYHWGNNDISPRGTGKTTIVPAETLTLDEKGNISSYVPKSIVFKDEEGFRPVCPFYEVWGIWEEEGKKPEDRPITIELLDKLGILLEDINWNIKISNHKPFHYTLDEADKIDCILNIKGNDFSKKELLGKSIEDSEKSIILGRTISMGYVQLVRPNDEFPELRLRYTPPKGGLYGPKNLNEVNSKIPNGQEEKKFEIHPDDLIVNPKSSWCKFNFTYDDDYRTNPGWLFAYYVPENGVYQSIGLIDDTGDGIISCKLNNELNCSARIVITPPDFAPDRRPFVSIADGLKDRVNRTDVLNNEYISEDTFSITSEEIQDLMERILETLELMNLDAQNDRAISTNKNIAWQSGVPREFGENKAFPIFESTVKDIPLPLTQLGRQKHRRFLSLEVFEDKLRENPKLLEDWIREPMSESKYYDRKMPPLMRGSDAYPMHLTKRQFYLLHKWSKFITNFKTESGT